MRTVKHILIAMILAIALLLTACGSEDETKKDEISQIEDTQAGDQINEEIEDKEEKLKKKEKDSKKKDENTKKQSDEKDDEDQTKIESTDKSNDNTTNESKASANSNSKSDTSTKTKSNKASSSNNKLNTDKNNNKGSKKSDSPSPKAPKKESNNTPSNKKPPPPPKKEETEQQEQSVTVSVTVPSGVSKGSGLAPTNVTIQDGDSVLDATKKTGMDLSVSGAGSMAYVRGINGLKEFDEGPLSGWLVKVDGVYIDRSAGAFKVTNNQRIEWVYTTDYTKN